ncbi:hypothetical protein BC829DRAFT_421825 [Chytridium lagenaria]|nr:hypothetical protein BC829DRAFT_421825 [Chytridium lagenaria]
MLKNYTIGNNNCKTARELEATTVWGLLGMFDQLRVYTDCTVVDGTVVVGLQTYDLAVNWYQLLRTGYVWPRTHPYFGSSTYRPFRAGLATAGPPETLTLTWPYYGTGSYRPDTDGPPNPAVFWYRFYRPDTDGPPDPAVFWYPFLQTGYGRPPTRPYFGTVLPDVYGRVQWTRPCWSQTGTLVTYVNCFDPSSYPVHTVTSIPRRHFPLPQQACR